MRALLHLRGASLVALICLLMGLAAWLAKYSIVFTGDAYVCLPITVWNARLHKYSVDTLVVSIQYG